MSIKPPASAAFFPSPMVVAPGVVQPGGKPFGLLVELFVDDSGSITNGGNAEAIRCGHNKILEDNKGRGDVRISTQYLNGFKLFGFREPADAVAMDESNYNPQEGTPLYEKTPDALRRLEKDAARFAQQFDVRTMFYILTDGGNTGPGTAQDVKAVVDRMIASGIHSVWGMGVDDGQTDFRDVFSQMGIPQQCILVLERTEADIARGMGAVTQTSRGARSHATFAGTSRTGFTVVQPRPAGGGEGTAGTALVRGTSSGPAPVRSPEEKGEVERDALLWNPVPVTITLPPGGGMASAGGATPIGWVPNDSGKGGGYYEMEPPQGGDWYLIGRLPSSDWQGRLSRAADQRADLGEIIKREGGRYVPLDDKRMAASPISGVHMLVARQGGQVRVIPLKGSVTILDPGDPKKDQEVPLSGVGLPPGSPALLRLAPGVVLRVKP